MSRDLIEGMANNLHEFWDRIDKHGLVNHHYGIAEDYITEGTPILPKLQHRTNIIL